MTSKPVVKFEIQGDIYIVTMCNEDNRFNPKFVIEFNNVLDQIQKHSLHESKGCALVLTGEDKFFSNGLDLSWMGQNSNLVGEFLPSLQLLLSRIIHFPVVTIANINGHAFAGGAMLALCCDLRIMNSEKGFFCLPEIDLNMSLTQGMNDLIDSKMTRHALRESLILGKRLNGDDCLKLNIVDAIDKNPFPLSLKTAEKYKSKSKNGKTLHVIKYMLYEKAIKSLTTPVPLFKPKL